MRIPAPRQQSRPRGCTRGLSEIANLLQYGHAQYQTLKAAVTQWLASLNHFVETRVRLPVKPTRPKASGASGAGSFGARKDWPGARKGASGTSVPDAAEGRGFPDAEIITIERHIDYNEVLVCRRLEPLKLNDGDQSRTCWRDGQSLVFSLSRVRVKDEELT
jgi:hypothetical protein